ncbi:MAG: flagellar biosynthesis protein FlhA [Holosporales bacterium]
MSELGQVTPQVFTLERFANAVRRGDVAFAMGLICILVMLVLPMPAWLMDMSLAISLMVSVLVLMTTLFIEKPLEFSSFPTVILVSTMLRLALNVASTRLILTHGHEGPGAAGDVIRAFGNFMMGGNFVIGLIVFAILVLVNFVVITKGSGRIAEVSARFTLDAMPGKQMAIDADLNAGIVNEEQAKERRKNLEQEANFFGAMDGAAKFVRGDAIAGLCITFINAVGGIIIGVAQNNLTLSQASHTYTLLTVGDGLVSQIPALIVSTAAGLLVSKVGQESSTDKALFEQLSAYPTALGMSSGLMVMFSLLPGIPMLPFLFLAGLTGVAAWRLNEQQEERQKQKALELEQANIPAVVEETPASSLAIDPIRVELGYGLLAMANGEQGQRLTDQIKALRKQFVQEMGFIVPTVRVLDNLQLAPDGYIIRVKDVEVARGELRSHMLLVMDPQGREITLPGEPTIEPTFGLKAMWINHAERQDAESNGYTVVDPMTVITTHLSEVIKDNASEMLSYAETQKLLDEMDKSQQKLIGDMVPSMITYGGIQRVLQNLLSERVSIRDLPTILEGIAEACGFTRNMSSITEHVRTRLARQLCAAHANVEGVVLLVMLSPEWERSFHEALVGEGDNRHLALPPSRLQEFTQKVKEVFDEQAMMGQMPVLVTSSLIRPHVRAIIERFRPLTIVMSQNEIHPKARIRTVARIA